MLLSVRRDMTLFVRIALTGRLQGVEALGASPILLIPAMSGAEQQAITARHLPVVEKPFDLETLLQAIDQFLHLPA
jgi:hypothetical protein